MTVVSVQSYQDIVLFGQSVSGLCQHDGPVGGILYVEAGSKLSASSGYLDDAVRFRVCKGFKGSINCYN